MSATLPQTVRCKRTLPGDYPLPAYAKPGDAGLDLAMRRWRLDASEPWRETTLNLRPKVKASFDIGIALELPPWTFGLVAPRSGLTVADIDAPVGVVDSGYRGSLLVRLRNHSDEIVVLEPGHRVAQLVVLPFVACNLVEVEALSPSERADSGFGSTGMGSAA